MGNQSEAVIKSNGERENLRNSELRYRRLFETAKDGILLLDANTGRITDVNPFLQDMLGYPHNELIGKSLWEIGAVKDIAASQDAMRQLQKKGIRPLRESAAGNQSGRTHPRRVHQQCLSGQWRARDSVQCPRYDQP
jgi:PAS domain S-box-containing protein